MFRLPDLWQLHLYRYEAELTVDGVAHEIRPSHVSLGPPGALVALHTSVSGPADRDAVTYWQDRRPDPVGAANGRRWSRVGASMLLDFRQLREVCLETAAATVTAAAATDPALRVSTQGHVLTAADLLTTLTIEASIHHLDLVPELPAAARPSATGPAAVRTTLDGLLGRPVPVDWTDEHYARAATGRAPLTETERRSPGPDTDRLPLLS
nr:hypothetical protein OG999_02670 [Streptomyces sp. NBC_00886]